MYRACIPKGGYPVYSNRHGGCPPIAEPIHLLYWTEEIDMTAHRSTNAWPSLRVDEWTPTRETLHMWTQIVGKIRLAHAPMVNHWWQVTLYVTPAG
ncbi:hypothetical protein NIIDMKKI_10850 [Mycobacterium kansasii]|uniref:Uncharacterized protein n=1 Tax=Mycobacterium kansasii TaxID=1768 RepID=A0A7G1I8P8_MYCKA|nr:hypothetical protein NIIDMKKI_10850 [Mycobacterium kansasii]